MLNYNHRPRCKQARRGPESGHGSVYHIQMGSGDNVWVPEHSFYGKMNIRERKPSPAKGKTRSESHFLQNWDFSQLMRLTLQSQSCETLEFTVINVGVAFSPMETVEIQRALSLEQLKDRSGYTYVTQNSVTFRENWCASQNGLEHFLHPVYGTGLNRSTQLRWNFSRDTQEGIGNMEKDTEGRKYSGH